MEVAVECHIDPVDSVAGDFVARMVMDVVIRVACIAVYPGAYHTGAGNRHSWGHILAVYHIGSDFSSLEIAQIDQSQGRDWE